MIHGKRMLAFVMAGGEGTRLAPLTSERSKPAVPFGSRHQLIDFVLSNLVNSNIQAIHVLVQYRSQDLIEHVRTVWPMNPMLTGQFVVATPPQMSAGTDRYQGTADAVAQNLHLIDKHRPDIVAVFGADHVYRMDVQQMVRHHLDHEAQVTVAALPVPMAEASGFGVLEVDGRRRITAFREKPKTPPSMPGRPTHALASMGNYLFDTEVLLAELRRARAQGETDFGAQVLPRLLRTHRLSAYDFHDNVIPGMTDSEERGYWRDVGTLDAYFDTHFDILSPNPKFRLQNRTWPIYGATHQGEAPQVLGGSLRSVSLGGGSMVDGACIERCVLRREVQVGEDAHLSNSIVMDGCVIGRGARIRRAIIDTGNVVPPHMRIGHDLDADRQRFHVTDSGIVVVARGQLAG